MGIFIIETKAYGDLGCGKKISGGEKKWYITEEMGIGSKKMLNTPDIKRKT